MGSVKADNFVVGANLPEGANVAPEVQLDAVFP